MLDMHKLTRYEHAPVLKFGSEYDAQQDASQLASWLKEFAESKGRPPKRLAFTFHAANENADNICAFMKACVDNEAVADFMSQASIDLTFVGKITDDVARSTQERIVHQTF
jgi:hypothetical protein